MNFRIFQFVETEKFQYLRIHKNGNLSVMKCIQDNFKDVVFNVNVAWKKPRVCIIRDPYERYLSGLKADLFHNNMDIKDVNLKKLFTSNENHRRNTWMGRINHSVSQIPYLMNTHVDHYIDMEDLNLFLKMHFGKSEHEHKFTEKVSFDIEEHISKEEVMKYLHLDYHVYNHIKKSPFLWEWQHGKIF